jgi:hypothetical protein
MIYNSKHRIWKYSKTNFIYFAYLRILYVFALILLFKLLDFFTIFNILIFVN